MRSPLLILLGIAIGSTFSTFVAMAWTGPTSAPPNSNIAAPVNVGPTDQVKDAALGVNGIAVFGNSILQSSSYLNWGATSGLNGYGIRDNVGTLEFKNSGGTWQSIQAIVFNLTAGSATWVDLTNSRALETTYTNTTGHPIDVSVSTIGQAPTFHCAISIFVNSVQVGYQFMNNNAGNGMCSATVTVPNGASYYAGNDGWSDITLARWVELR